jgi:hypothetical protein
MEISIVMLVQLVGHDDASALEILASSMFTAYACGEMNRKNIIRLIVSAILIIRDRNLER